MTKKITFLLVSNICDDYWHRLLEETLSHLGPLQIHPEETIRDLVSQQNFALIIIDAAGVSDTPFLVSHIRANQPSARVVVATASPTWKHAREVFYAGASDYIRKLSDKGEILSSLQSVLKKPLPANIKKKRI
jgi:DNA-binding NarL/FixJ family response regulator